MKHTINFTVFSNELENIWRKKHPDTSKSSTDFFCFTKDEITEALKASGIPNEIIADAIETLVVEDYLLRYSPASQTLQVAPAFIGKTPR